MTVLKFTEKVVNPESGKKADDCYKDTDTDTITAFDLVSDPMTVDIDVDGFDNSGNPVTNSVSRSFDKADWDGEDITP